MEACKAKNIEVLLLTSTIDEFVMNTLMNYSGKALESVENAKLSVDGDDAAEKLSDADAEGLRAWMVDAIPGVKAVDVSTRLVDSPAIVVGHESASMRKMMSMMEAGRAPELPPQQLEINAGHPIIRNLATVRTTQPELAGLVAQQLFANALVTAGILDDPRSMIDNLNSILDTSLKAHMPADGA
jgi:HSP90 family molecular chaperone